MDFGRWLRSLSKKTMKTSAVLVGLPGVLGFFGPRGDHGRDFSNNIGGLKNVDPEREGPNGTPKLKVMYNVGPRLRHLS